MGRQRVSFCFQAPAYGQFHGLETNVFDSDLERVNWRRSAGITHQLIDGVKGCGGSRSRRPLQQTTSCPCGDSLSFTQKWVAFIRKHRPGHHANHARHSLGASCSMCALCWMTLVPRLRNDNRGNNRPSTLVFSMCLSVSFMNVSHSFCPIWARHSWTQRPIYLMFFFPGNTLCDLLCLSLSLLQWITAEVMRWQDN